MPQTEMTLPEAVEAAFGADPELTAAVLRLAGDDTESEEAQALAVNLGLLAGAAPRRLWPAQDEMRPILDRHLLTSGAAVARALEKADQESAEPVLRSSFAMVLELIHASGDANVLANDPDGWLWGPSGPPVRAADPPDPDLRYADHAAALGRRWDRGALRAWARWERDACAARAYADHPDVLKAPDALLAGYRALGEAEDVVDEWSPVAAAQQPEAWPPEMAEASARGWSATSRIRDAAHAVLAAAVVIEDLAIMSEEPQNDIRGWMLAVSEARARTLQDWWDQIGPKPAAADSVMSFWLCGASPSRFWAAALTAAAVEMGRTRNGGGAEGIALALVNR